MKLHKTTKKLLQLWILDDSHGSDPWIQNIAHFCRLGDRLALGSGVNWTVKKGLGWIWATFEAHFLKFSTAKNYFDFFWKYCKICTEKLHRIKVKKILGNILYRGKTCFFRAKNLSVIIKTIWSVLCFLLLYS